MRYHAALFVLQERVLQQEFSLARGLNRPLFSRVVAPITHSVALTFANKLERDLHAKLGWKFKKQQASLTGYR
jgi:hypothetical protein